jgi:hypothetical protein
MQAIGGLCIALRGQVNADDKDVINGEACVNAEELSEACNQQTRKNQKQGGKSNFEANQTFAKAASPTAFCRGCSARLESINRLGTSDAQGGEDPEKRARSNGDDESE